MSNDFIYLASKFSYKRNLIMFDKKYLEIKLCLSNKEQVFLIYLYNLVYQIPLSKSVLSTSYSPITRHSYDHNNLREYFMSIQSYALITY